MAPVFPLKEAKCKGVQPSIGWADWFTHRNFAREGSFRSNACIPVEQPDRNGHYAGRKP